MTDIVVGVRLTANGDGLVGQLRISNAELKELRAASQGAAQGARDLNAATGAAAGGARELATATGAATEAQRASAAEARQGAAALGENEQAADRAAGASTRVAAANRDLTATFTSVTNATRVSGGELGRWSNDGLVWLTTARKMDDANKGLTTNIGLQRAGWQGVGFQLQDVFASYSSGSKLTTIFAQQSGQLASAISMIAAASENGEGKLGKFASFIGGGWGIAIGVGISVLSTLVASMMDAGSESEKVKDKSLDLTDALDRQKASYRDLLAAIDDYNDRQKKATETSHLATLEARDAAKANYAEALSVRERLAAKLYEAEQYAEKQRMFGGPAPDPALGFGGMQDAYRDNEAKIAALRTEIGNRTFDLGEQARKALDPLEAIRQKYEDIDRVLRRMSKGGQFNGVPVNKVIEQLGRRQRAEEEAARKAQRPSTGTAGTLADFGSPLSGYSVTGRFGDKRPGHTHAGLDMAAAMGTPVYAAQSGVVQFAGTAGAYGNLIKLGHGAGTETRYGHLSRIAVGDSQAVAKGDLIGNVGSTGRSTGPHLHYEVRVNGKAVDPTKGQFPIDEAKIAEAGQKAADHLQQFGDRSSNVLQRIAAQFGEQPKLISAASAATADLEAIIKEVNDKLATGGGLTEAQRAELEKIKATAEGLKPVVEAGMVKPFRDFLQASQEAAEIDQLLIAGKDDQAEAMKIILGLEREMGPLTADQAKDVLATVQAEKDRALVLRDQRALIAGNVSAVRDMRSALEQTVADMFRGKFSFNRILNSLGNSAIQTMSQRVVESMFGDTLRALERQAEGGPIDKAGTRMAGAMDKGSDAVSDFADVVRRASSRIDGSGAGGAAGSAIVGAFEGAPGSLEDMFDSIFGGGDITVVGNKAKSSIINETRSIVVDMADGLLRSIGIKLPAAVVDVVQGAMGRIEKSLPDLMKGGLIGASAASLLGDKGSGIGGAIGGALGDKLGEKFLSKGLEKITKGLGDFAGPLGAIAGGLIGGLVGGLFKKTKYGTAVLTGSGDPSVSGNSASRQKAASGLAGSVQDGLGTIADQLGGILGDYNVSIGMYKDKYRVSTTGYSGKLKNGKSGVVDFGKEGAEDAVRFAISDAIADGAIEGLSAAVQQAIRSNSDLDKALKEALKVQEVELLVGGLGAQIEKAFSDFEKQAAERVRIAKQYGFDVLKIEEINAKDRLKVADQLLSDQVGGLQSLVDELTRGSLFEGSAVDQRQKILDAIVGAKTSADAGEEGAADKLADLLEQLNAVSKDVYGTSAGFADDRSSILAQAQDVIAKANQRIADAQAATAPASDPALTTTNESLDEANDQLAQIASSLGIAVDQLQFIANRPGGDTTYDYLAEMARTSKSEIY